MSLTINQAAGIYGTANAGGGMAVNVAGVLFTSDSTQGSVCNRVEADENGWAPSQTILAMAIIAPSGTTITPGTYDIVESLGSLTAPVAQGFYAQFDASCDATPPKKGSSDGGGPSDSLTGGTVTLDVVDSQTIQGSFDGTFNGGAELMGTFNVQVCNHSDLTAVFNCSNDGGSSGCCG